MIYQLWICFLILAILIECVHQECRYYTQALWNQKVVQYSATKLTSEQWQCQLLTSTFWTSCTIVNAKRLALLFWTGYSHSLIATHSPVTLKNSLSWFPLVPPGKSQESTSLQVTTSMPFEICYLPMTLACEAIQSEPLSSLLTLNKTNQKCSHDCKTSNIPVSILC